MVEYRSCYIPVAFGFLPDKTDISYKVFVILAMEALKKRGTTVTIRKFMMDFELNIHRAFDPLFETRGCYFHFSQCIWRRVQSGGHVSTYMNDSDFRAFVHSVAALPFFPLTEL